MPSNSITSRSFTPWSLPAGLSLLQELFRATPLHLFVVSIKAAPTK